MRITIRLNKEEAAELKLLMAMTSIDEKSTVLKFAVGYTISSFNFVARSLIPPNYELILSRRSKTHPSKKVFYFDK